MVETAHLPPNGCTITKATEITQTHSTTGCHCDPVLNCDVISVATCNLTDGTILHVRPANSWISADTVNGSHRYSCSMSPLNVHLTTIYPTHHTSTCPLLTNSVSLTGLVCYVDIVNKVSVLYLVHHGVKNVPFIITPIAIAGIVLVHDDVVFVLKLTVTNGTINMFNFYVNIVNTNYSSLLLNCNLPICIITFNFQLN